jgi:hypothetical protein
VNQVRDGFSDEALKLLQPLAPQITWLDLGRTDVTDRGLNLVSEMQHLTRLHLDHTGVTDAGLAHIRDLPHLEYINLYGTEVTDAGLDHLATVPKLSKVYLWQTNATAAGVESFRGRRPDVHVNIGSNMIQADSVVSGSP